MKKAGIVLFLAAAVVCGASPVVDVHREPVKSVPDIPKTDLFSHGKLVTDHQPRSQLTRDKWDVSFSTGEYIRNVMLGDIKTR